MVVALLILAVRLFVVDRVWPETRVQTLLDQGAAALVTGQLSSVDGSGAREAYEAAQALDPDDARPGIGLSQVADAAVLQAQAAVEAGRYADAHAALRLARDLSAPRPDTDAVANALRSREAADAGLPTLLARAQNAQVVGHLDGDGDAALPLYQRILALQPDHGDALRGREDALGALLDGARTQLRSGALRDAADLIAAVRSYDAGHVDLPETEARLTEEVDALRRRADNHLAAGRVTQAVAEWRALQAFDADDAAATRGLQDAAALQARRAERLARDFDFAGADAALAEADGLAADSETVREARLAIDASRSRYAQLTPQLPTAQRRQRVAVLLREASDAEVRGDLLTPPGDSAYDKIRAARALSPDDESVARASARLLPAARQCFDAGLRANNLARARGCLDARDLLGDGEPALREARRRLSQRWLAIGDERLGAENFVGARAALESARALDPGVPGHAELERRLRAAPVSGN